MYNEILIIIALDSDFGYNLALFTFYYILFYLSYESYVTFVWYICGSANETPKDFYRAALEGGLAEDFATINYLICENIYQNSYFYCIEDFEDEVYDPSFEKKKLRFRKKIWIDIWEINTKITSLENRENLPWGMYYKYKLSMFNSWHVLEDRILNFFTIIIFFIS